MNLPDILLSMLSVILFCSALACLIFGGFCLLDFPLGPDLRSSLQHLFITFTLIAVGFLAIQGGLKVVPSSIKVALSSAASSPLIAPCARGGGD